MNRFSFAVAILAVLAVCAGAQGATYTFTDSAPGVWDFAADWGGLGYPGAVDTANIDFNAYGYNPIVNMDSAYGVSNLTFNGGTISNSGLLSVNGLSAYSLTVPTNVSLAAYQGLGGNGTIVANGGIALSGGTLAGNLHITGNVTMSGNSMIDPGETAGGNLFGTVGTVAISGGLNITGGQFNLDFGGPAGGVGFDKITTTGALALAGTLDINAVPGFMQTGMGTTTYNFMTYGSVSGAMSLMANPPNTVINANNPAPLLTYGAITTGGGNVSLPITRIAGTFTWTGGGGAYTNYSNPANWDLGTLVPYSYSTTMDKAIFNLAGNPVVDCSHVCTTAAGSYSTPFGFYLYTATLNGNGAITFNGGSYSDLPWFWASSSAPAITAAAGQTVQGNSVMDLDNGYFLLNGGSLAGTLRLMGYVKSTGGSINPGETVNGTTHGTVGTIVLAYTGNTTLVLDAASTLNWDLGSDSAHSDQLVSYGEATLGGTAVNLFNAGGMVAGDYRLMTYTRTANATDTVGTVTAPAGHTAQVIAYPTFLAAVIDQKNYAWNASSAANWSAVASWTGGATCPGAGTTDIPSFALAASPIATMDVAATVPALTLSGAGTLTINGSAAKPLTVTNGIVLIDSQTLTGNATINGNLTLYDYTAGTPAILGGSLTINGNAGVIPGTQAGGFSPGTGGTGSAHTPGLIAIGGNLNPWGGLSNTNWYFNLNTPATPGTTFDQITATGYAGINGLLNVYSIPAGSGSIRAGDYHVITYNGFGGWTPGTWTAPAAFPAGYAATPSADGTTKGMVVLVGPSFVDVNVGGTQYTWAGGASGTWGTSGNWTSLPNGGTTPGSATTDIVNYAGTGVSTITLGSAVTIPMLRLTGSGGTLIIAGSGTNQLTVTDGINLGATGLGSQTLKAGNNTTTIYASIMMGAVATTTLGDTTNTYTTNIVGDVWAGIRGRFANVLDNVAINGNLYLGNYSTSSTTINGANSANAVTLFAQPGSTRTVGSSVTGSTLAVTSGNITLQLPYTSTPGSYSWATFPANLTLQFGAATANFSVVNAGGGPALIQLNGPVTGNSGMTFQGGPSGMDELSLGTTFNGSGLAGTVNVGGGAYTSILGNTNPAGGDFSSNVILNLASNGKFLAGVSGTETFGGLTGTGVYDVETTSACGLTIDNGISTGTNTFNGGFTVGIAPGTAPVMTSSFTLTKTGAGTQVFGPGVSLGGGYLGVNVSGGTLTMNGAITSASAVTTSTGGTLNGSGTIAAPLAINGGTLAGTLVVTGNANSTGGTINGTPTINGAIAHSGGVLTVNGTLGGSGLFNVNSGTVNGAGNINHAMAITGGTLSGTPTITGNVSSTAGTFTPGTAGTAGTIQITGNVTLDHNTTLNYDLGTPGVVGGTNDLITITGGLSLDGTLNINGLTGFGLGTYRLFNYTGSLSGAGLTVGTVPILTDTYTIDTSTAGQVNLVIYPPYLAGDVNRDGVLDEHDIDAIYGYMRGSRVEPLSQCDVNSDGAVNQLDITYELHTYFHTNYGDWNLDRKTDFVDFQTLLDHWQATGAAIGWTQGDGNGDGKVDFLDFQMLLDYWNPGGWSFAPAQAPEPATLSLILLGGLALLRRSRK